MINTDVMGQPLWRLYNGTAFSKRCIVFSFEQASDSFVPYLHCMTAEEISNQYYLNDGTVNSFRFNISKKEASIELSIRKPSGEARWQPCTIRLTFSGVSEVNLFEDFPTGGSYSDVTFLKLEDGSVYLSLDPFGNSSLPHEEDNWVIKASGCDIVELP